MALFNKKKTNEYLDNTTKKSLSTKLIELLGGTINCNADLFQDLFVLLVEADIGSELAKIIIDQLKEATKEEFMASKEFIIDKLCQIIKSLYKPIDFQETSFIMLVGINGSGKTTSISKLANYYLNKGKSVGLIAGDTFRAGAVKQIQNWADKLNIQCITGKENADPSSVLVEGCRYYMSNKVDVVIADTAGRLQNKENLMKELEKMIRVCKRELHSDDMNVWLTIDATIGQNSLIQAEAFVKSSMVNGIILTKMDGSSKGGVVLNINNKYSLPICYITYGENIEAIRSFDIDEFIETLVKGN